jgi:RHS repeat-associated protein
VRDGASNPIAQSSVVYDEPAYPLIAYGSVTGWIDPQTAYRGNATTSSRWLNFPTSIWLQTHAQYDQCGSMKNAWDELGHQSQVDYSSTYFFAYLTTNTSPPPDASGTYAQPASLVASTVYDFNTGLVTSATDENQRITDFEYDDSLRRPTKVIRPDGGWTSTSYSDVPGNNHVRTQTLQHTTPSQQVIDSYQYFDKLGRTIRSFTNEGSTYITQDTQYDNLGRVSRVSNPYRTSSLTDPVNPSNQWVTNTYDTLSRLQAVTTPDSAHTDTAYGYSLTGYLGTTVTSSDQTGKSRKVISDAQGRIVQTTEDLAVGGLNYQTNYTFDILDNLRKVEQGSQLRYFGYDSLSRVIRVRHVEQNINTNLAWTDPVTGYSGWTAALTYDATGNVTRRTDARNVITDLQYDQIDRITIVRYTNDPQNTPGRDNYYDGYRQNVDNNIPDSKGRLWQSETLNEVRFTMDQFDVVGRSKVQKQQFWTGSAWSSPYQSSATYNLAGSIVTETYPSGRSVNFTYDPLGRVKIFSGNLGDCSSRTYADTFEYNAWGALQQEKFGTQTPLYHKRRYNVRGQLWDVRLSTVSFSSNPAEGNRGSIVNYYNNTFTQGGSGTENNGNLLRQEINVPSSNFFQQNYTYDPLNRLKSASEKLNGTGSDSFKQVFDYDRWGNRTVNFDQSTTNVPRPTYTVDTSTNRLVAPSGFNYGYDNAGNQTNDNYTGNGQRTFNAENHMLSAQGTLGAWQYYKYGGDGLRVRRIVNGQETWQVFGLGGELIAEYPANGGSASPQKEYGYRGGQLLVSADSNSGGGAGAQNVVWTNGVGVSISGNNLTRTAAGDAWNAGAVSSQSIASGDGYAEFTATETNKRRSMGLTDNTSVTGYQHIDYGFHLGDNGQITIHEGVSVYGVFGTYATGDKLRVAIEGGVVKYRKNGTLLRTSTLAPTYPLYAGGAPYTNAGTVSGAVLSSGGSSSSTQLRWLVTDHLGSPRMLVDETGNLAGVIRHDFLPFGEEMGTAQVGLIGARDTTPGYVAATIRQRFTGYEYDSETGLNFAQARYQSPVQGRFTSVDPLGASASTTNPQSLNRYSYVSNQPLTLTDPDGMMAYHGADLGSSDVSDGFWGGSLGGGLSSRDHIAEGMARHDSIIDSGYDPAFGHYRGEVTVEYTPPTNDYKVSTTLSNPTQDEVYGAMGGILDSTQAVTQARGGTGGGSGSRSGSGGKGNKPQGNPQRDPRNWDYRGRGHYVYVGPGSWTYGTGRPKKPAPAFRNLKDHAARHSQQRQFRPWEYYQEARLHMTIHRWKFNFYHDSQFKVAFVTPVGQDLFMFTSTAPSRNRIFTHMTVTQQYLSNLGITLPQRK